jgi:hypothetical protein
MKYIRINKVDAEPMKFGEFKEKQRTIKRMFKAALGFVLGVCFGVVAALVMPLATACEVWREGGEE